MLDRRHLPAYALLITTALIALVPIAWVLFASLRTSEAVAAAPFGLPIPPILDNYVEAWSTARFATYTINSLIVAAGTVLIVVVVAVLAAYGLTVLRPPGSNALLAFFIIGLILPIWALINPLFRLVRDVGLLDTHAGVILVQAAIGLPLAIFLLRAFMRDVPRELFEAAHVDGASNLRIIWSVLLPISRPVIFTLVVFQFMFSWNEFVIPLFFLQSDEIRTLPLGLSFFQGRFGSDQSLVSAGAMLASLPVIIVYLVFQRQFISGLTAGAAKG